MCFTLYSKWMNIGVYGYGVATLNLPAFLEPDTLKQATPTSVLNGKLDMLAFVPTASSPTPVKPALVAGAGRRALRRGACTRRVRMRPG